MRSWRACATSGATPASGCWSTTIEEDWSRLAFVQVTGVAAIVEPGSAGHEAAIAALRAKYPQYRSMAIERRPVIAIEQLRTRSWGLA